MHKLYSHACLPTCLRVPLSRKPAGRPADRPCARSLSPSLSLNIYIYIYIRIRTHISYIYTYHYIYIYICIVIVVVLIIIIIIKVARTGRPAWPSGSSRTPSANLKRVPGGADRPTWDLLARIAFFPVLFTSSLHVLFTRSNMIH